MAARPTKTRLPGPREPNGRLLRSIVREADYHPTAVKRLIVSSLDRMTDPVWSSPLGRLVLEGKVTLLQFSAAIRWDETWRAYLAAHGAPVPDPRGARFERAAPGYEPEPESDAGQARSLAELRAIRRYDKALAALRCCGAEAEAAVRLVAQGRGQSLPNYRALLRLKFGLDALVSYWGLGRPIKPKR